MKKFLIIFIFNILITNSSYALIEIDITRKFRPLPIAVSPLHVDIKSEEYDGLKLKLVKIFQKL